MDRTADEYYSLYTDSLVRGKQEAVSGYRRLWLDAQTDELPGGVLGECYREKIVRLKEESREHTEFEGTSERDERLLSLRFSYKRRINGRENTYRELSAGVRINCNNREFSNALVDEAFMLAENGLPELIVLRNRIARNAGFDDYWKMMNGPGGVAIAAFLSRMELLLLSGDFPVNDYPEKDKPESGVPGSGGVLTGGAVPLKRAVEFFLSLLYSASPLPKMELKLRKGAECPQGPPSVIPMAYGYPGRPSGHLLSLDLPFVREGMVEQESLGALFHELTHLFHFASVDVRGGWAFPPELAAGNLFYEAEALCFQNIVSAIWKKEALRFDSGGLKDLVYVAESERLLYETEPSTARAMKAFLKDRMRDIYPDGGFTRTPIGASHLLLRDAAGRYWNYPGAAFLGIKKAVDLCFDKKSITPPEYWSEGNQPSWEEPAEDLLSDISDKELFNLYEFEPDKSEFERKEVSDLRMEMEEAGIRF